VNSRGEIQGYFGAYLYDVYPFLDGGYFFECSDSVREPERIGRMLAELHTAGNSCQFGKFVNTKYMNELIISLGLGAFASIYTSFVGWPFMKPFNCPYCFGFWLSFIYFAFTLQDFTSIAYAGISSSTAYLLKRIYEKI